MAATLAQIWRHPVKGVSAEPLDRVALDAGQPMAFDRRWAIAHGSSAFDSDNPAWVKRRNFVVQAHVPELARTAARFDEATETLTLSHPSHGEVSLQPGRAEGAAALTDWIEPLAGAQQPGPYRIASIPGAHLADMEANYISILSLASLRALSQHAGTEMHVRRFRGNLWLEGLAPWEEESWVGKEIAIGPVRLRVDEPIGRCRATEASPQTGAYDVQTVHLLQKTRGHTEFGVYATVIAGGDLAVGATVEV